MENSPHTFTWLLVPALVGLLLFLLLLSWSHPLADLPEPAARESVVAESRLFLEKSGLDPGTLAPFPVLRSNDALLERQIAHFGKSKLSGFIRNGFLRFIPSYHWQVSWFDSSVNGDRNITMESYLQPPGVTIFRTTHSPDGAVLSLYTDHRSGPQYRLSDLNSLPFTSEKPDYQDVRPVLRGTVWDNFMMRVDSTYRSEQYGELRVTTVLVPKTEIFAHLPRITVRQNAEGVLLEIRQDVLIDGQPVTETESRDSFFRVIFLVVAFLLIVIHFARRIFHRLVDLRTATMYGAIAATLFALHMIQLLFQSTTFSLTDQQFFQIIALVIIMIVVSVVFGLFTFILSGLGESLSREVWPEKIHTLSMLRLGYLDSSSVGNAITAGVLGAFVFLGLAAVVYTLSDHSYLSLLDNQLFYSDSYLFPLWQLLIRNLFLTLLIAGGIFGCLLSWVRINRKSVPWLLISGATAFTLFSPYQVITPGSPLIFGFWFVPGLAITWFFLRQDMLALIVAVFVFLLLWGTVDGRLVAGSPDALLSWSPLALSFLLLGAGAFLAGYGKNYGHLPELTPSYILEIAREQRVEHELEIAHQVHQSFLPVYLPKLDGMEVAAGCYPAFDVGGDYYDVIPVDDHRMAFVVGDVSGKGIQAAFFMTMVKGIFQSLVKEIPEPVPLLTRMNRLFYDNARRGSFISICYGLMDAQDGSLRYARAGHNPAILLGADGKKTRWLRSNGMALGLTRNDDFERSLSEVSLTLSPKDLLLCYTDGVTEATNPSGAMFGEQKLLSDLTLLNGMPADQVLNRLTASVKAFTGSSQLSDDMTMVVVRKL